MKRRSFFGLLAGLPFLGALKCFGEDPVDRAIRNAKEVEIVPLKSWWVKENVFSGELTLSMNVEIDCEGDFGVRSDRFSRPAFVTFADGRVLFLEV